MTEYLAVIDRVAGETRHYPLEDTRADVAVQSAAAMLGITEDQAWSILDAERGELEAGGKVYRIRVIESGEGGEQ